MTSLESLLGDTLLKGTGTMRTTDLTPKVTGLYFSAHWCPPCRGFTPTLAETYKQLKADKKDLEIIFVSSDKSQKEFDEYFAEMPWLALPFEDRDRKASLSKRYKVNGIPTLILLDEEGKLLNKDGRSVITADPKGQDFPWPKKSFSEVLGGSFLNAEGTVSKEAIDGKVLGIYFSAHWCPPCQAFTPELVKTYNTLKDAGKPFEIIFASSDRSEEQFQEYFDDMPWLAIPYEDRARKNALSTYFGVGGIPTLVLVDSDGSVINTSGRSAVSEDPTGLEYPWRPKPVNDLSSGSDGLNEEICVITLMEEVDETMQAQIETNLRSVAEEHVAQRKATDGQEGCLFFTAKTGGGIADRIRQLCKLNDGDDSNTAANKAQPTLLILDIPDEGGFYVYEGDEEVNATTVRGFIASYQAKTLQRQQLA